MGILDSSGRQYTSAAQDMRLDGLKEKFLKVLKSEISHALKTTKTGSISLHADLITSVIDAAYAMGREDGGG